MLIYLLIKLLKVCPEAIADVTVRDETIFHLAVKNDMFEAFQVLVGWLMRSRHEPAHWKKELLTLDFQSQYPWNERQADRIIDMLSKAGGLSGSSSSLPNTSISSFHIESLKDKMSRSQKWATRLGQYKKGMAHEMRNTFLVATVLIITTTYEASLNPPKKPDESPSMKFQVSLSKDQALTSHIFLHKADINTEPIPGPSTVDVSKKDDWTFDTPRFGFTTL
ncbi:hypothetical protein PVK06_036549 [Gossypium arboreum]|uniref:Uncharacterized protein n=1 Tax=Gossypium arboreum TaxID=29729 RepID=A0ABR0NM25_GOSAR|nr:hypothetical protein PVK06_036549 [Gossypium arboreum]